ncbi:hypothetical protein E9993_11240 [Labilibacter sediminis]|nr:hypothetical protein E9993_11240 [Labilibacter sediminis]
MKEDFKILGDIKKQNNSAGFKVPDNYFESIEDKVMGAIEAEEKPLAKKVVMVLKPWLALAAVFTLIALVYHTVPYIIDVNKPIAQASYNNISLDFLSTRYDESELIDFILEDDNEGIYESLKTDPELLEGISLEDVEDLVIF